MKRLQTLQDSWKLHPQDPSENLDVHQWASHTNTFIRMFTNAHRKMFMFIKKRKDCPVKFQFSTGLCKSNECVVH